ncbi:MAG: Ig-like domain-containing protein, partial [Erysipelotrichaceae bacterium]|nr:Ig-like domain-containing protein [Erysipelotrichaceae bacterium]
DAVSYVEQAMGSTEKESYWGAENTNGYQLKYADGRNAWFTGNPYIAEPKIDEERFAINSKTTIKNARYTTYRNSVAQIVLVRDADGNIVDKFGFDATPTVGAYYNSQASTPGWVYTGANVVPVGITAKELGYDEGSQFSIDVYTVPEYFGVIANEGKGNKLTEDQLLEFIENGEVGDGAALGYKFTIDNTAPEIIKYEVSEDKKTVTVTAKDNNYISFIGLTDVQGNEVIAGEVPEQSEPGQEVNVTLDLSKIDLSTLPNAAALIVGDYARNENVRLIRFNEGNVEIKKYIYQLTDTLRANSEYIVATGYSGKVKVITSNGDYMYTGVVNNIPVQEDGNLPYILESDADDAIVWNTVASESGVLLQNKGDDCYLRYVDFEDRYATFANAGLAVPFMYYDYCLINGAVQGDDGEIIYVGMNYDGSAFYFVYNPGNIFIFEKTEIIEEIDPEAVSKIKIDPAKTTLILGVDETKQLNATVSPITVEDKTVKWESSDTSIATVDENGLVKAVSVGQVTITATSNQTPAVSATALVNVVTATPINGYINAQVKTAEGIYYAGINLSNMSFTPYAEAEEVYNGGRSGNYVYGINKNNAIHRYDAEEFAIDSEFEVTVDKQYVMIDGATIPNWVGVSEAGGALDYAYVAAGVSAANKLVFYTNTGNLWYLDTEIEDIVAMALIDYNLKDPTDPEFDYALLTADGSLYLYYVYGIEVDSGIDVDGGAMLLGKVGGITISDDLTAYTMTCSTGHIFTEDGEPDLSNWGLFIGDN